MVIALVEYELARILVLLESGSFDRWVASDLIRDKFYRRLSQDKSQGQ